LVTKRAGLQNRLLEAAKKEDDSDRIGHMLYQFSMVSIERQIQLAQELWNANPKARPAIRWLLGNMNKPEETRRALEKLEQQVEPGPGEESPVLKPSKDL
jgi:hypothetical protein